MSAGDDHRDHRASRRPGPVMRSRGASEVVGEVVGGDSELPGQGQPAGVVDDVELRGVGDLDLAGGVRRDEIADAERIGDGA